MSEQITDRPPPARLVLRRAPGGDRHFINDTAIRPGDPIRVYLGGAWRTGRYEPVWKGGRIVAASFFPAADSDRGFLLEPSATVALLGPRGVK